MKLRGNLMRNGQAVARGLSISLRVQGMRWSGQVQLPKGTTLLEGSYQLQLHDRRTGRIMINVIDGDTACFEGDGELKTY
ncbi:MAG: hypothetical protein L0Y71_14995 [Gemmataceae bacterium]|nr:hypothetical protein [Gemmataceae bacterium]